MSAVLSLGATPPSTPTFERVIPAWGDRTEEEKLTLPAGKTVYHHVYLSDLWRGESSFVRCATNAAACLDGAAVAGELERICEDQDGDEGGDGEHAVAVRFAVTDPGWDRGPGIPLPGLGQGEFKEWTVKEENGESRLRWAPNYNAPGFAAVHAQALSLLAKALEEHCPGDQTAWVEIGTFGFWGEWNFNEEPEASAYLEDWATRRRIVAQYYQAFPQARLAVVHDAFLDHEQNAVWDTIHREDHKELVADLTGACVGLRSDNLGEELDAAYTLQDAVVSLLLGKSEPGFDWWADEGSRTRVFEELLRGPWGGELYVDNAAGHLRDNVAGLETYIRDHRLTHISQAGYEALTDLCIDEDEAQADRCVPQENREKIARVLEENYQMPI